MGSETDENSAKLNLGGPHRGLSKVQLLCNALQPIGEQ